MSAAEVSKPSLSPSCSDQDKLNRPAFLSISPGGSPSHHRHHLSNGHSITDHGVSSSQSGSDSNTAQSGSDSPSTDGGLGQSEGNSSSHESTGHNSGSDISTLSRVSPKEEKDPHGNSDSPGDSFHEDIDTARKNYLRGGCHSVPLPPSKNGVYKMSLKAMVQRLLARIASRDEFYLGLDDFVSSSPATVGGYSSLGEGPGSFHPVEGSSARQLPFRSAKSASVDSPFFHISTLVSNSNRMSKGLPRKRGGVWTLNLLDGNLFLFKTNPQNEAPLERESEEEDDLMEGIELAKLLAGVSTPSPGVSTPSPGVSTSSTGVESADCEPVLYFHLPATILYAEVNNPHVTPVETPPTPKSMYRIDRQHDPKKMTPTEYILHHDTVFLVLDEQHHPPVINAVTEEEMIKTLEMLSEEGKSFPEASFNPVVNIKFEAGHSRSATHPNNIAIYFTGKHNKFRYYVETDEQGRLIPLKKELPLPEDDWKKHLEFSNCYFTPPAGFGGGASVGVASGGVASEGEGLPSISEGENED